MIKRPTTAFVSRDAVRYNYSQIKRHLSNRANGVNILAVVKADAYGHGAPEVSKILESLGCRHFGVARLEEAVELRDAGITSNIIILGGVYEGQERDVIKYGLTPVVFNEKSVYSLNNAAAKKRQKVNIHVKIDTGMGRLGIMPHDAAPFFKKIQAYKNIAVEGILTHLAEMDEDDKGFSGGQLKLFLKVIEEIKALDVEPFYKHIANSAAMFTAPQFCFNLVRPGIMLYGVYPDNKLKERLSLKPVLEMKTRIVQLKKLPSGSSVSYGRTFTVQRDSKIAIVPIGYGDGYPRHLSNKGEMLVRGRRVRVAGVVCMDLTMLDVTDIRNVREGDEVTIIGRDGRQEISAEELAEKAGTIPYEILCNIGKRVARKYV